MCRYIWCRFSKMIIINTLQIYVYNILSTSPFQLIILLAIFTVSILLIYGCKTWARVHYMYLYVNLQYMHQCVGMCKLDIFWNFLVLGTWEYVWLNLSTRFPEVRSTWNSHQMKFAQLASQHRQIEQMTQSRSCGRSLENHKNVVPGNRNAGVVL